MHVLIVIHDFQPGGVERIATRLAARWAGNGVKVTLVCGRPVGALKSLLTDKVSVVSPFRGLKRRPLSRLRLAAFAARVAQKERPDVIFLPGNFYAGSACLIRLSLGADGPRIVCKLSNPLRRSERGSTRQWLFGRSLQWKTKFCDHLVFMSAELRQEAISIIPGIYTKSSVIDEPVLDDHSEAWRKLTSSVHGEPVKLVAAARLVPQKSLEVMITAMTMIADPEARLTIFGDGSCRAQLEARIRSLGLERRVILAGYSEDWRMDLRDARLFLLSSEFEGFPAVVIEALAAGVPVVATNCSPSIHTVLKSTALGTVVDRGNPRAFAAGIDAQLSVAPPDPLLLAKSVERFRLDRSAGAYTELFGELAARSSGAVLV